MRLHSTPITYSLLLAACLLQLAAGTAAAQRSFQNYWLEKYQEMNEPEIIEDARSPIDPTEERYLYDGAFGPHTGVTVFVPPETGEPPAVESEALRSYALGSLTGETGNATQALRAFEDALKQDPENNWLRIRTARKLAALHDLSRAETLLQTVIEDDPQDFRALLTLGEIAFQRQRYQEARERFQAVLDIRPENLDALRYLAQMAYQVDRDLEQTKEYARQILSINDNHLTAMLLNAEASALTGDAEEAANFYQRLVRYQPGLIQQMLEIARRLAAAGRTDEAIILYERAMIINPGQDSVRLAWEQLLTRRDGERAVEEAYERLVEDAGNDLRVFELYAEYLKRQDDWDALYTLRERMLRIDANNIKSLMDMATYYNRRGDHDSADLFYQQAIRSGPTDPDIYMRIAEIYMTRGEFDRARPLLLRALALAPDDALGLQALAAIELELDNATGAENLLRKALEASPNNAAALKQLGLLYLAQDQREKAVDHLRRSVSSDPRDLTAWMALARLYMQDEDAKSLDTLEGQALASLGGLPHFQIEYGILAQEFGMFERSRRALERALRTSPDNLRARGILAQTFLKLNLPDQAIKTLEELDDHIGAHQLAEIESRDRILASVLLDAGRLAEAEKLFARLVESNPDDLYLVELHLQTLLRSGKKPEAEKILERTIQTMHEEYPTDVELLRAAVAFESGDVPGALEILQPLQREEPDNLEVAFRVALAASEINDIELSEDSYSRIIDAGHRPGNPYYTTALNNLAYLFARNDHQLDRAEQLVRRALDINPNAPYILDTMGWVYYKQGEYEKARTFLERAARLDGRDAEILTNLGQLYETIGEKDLALTTYDRAIEINPSMTTARERREAILGSVRAE